MLTLSGDGELVRVELASGEPVRLAVTPEASAQGHCVSTNRRDLSV